MSTAIRNAAPAVRFDAGLEHEEFAVPDGELDVAHVAVVRLELRMIAIRSS
jgi:hypothetical protein